MLLIQMVYRHHVIEKMADQKGIYMTRKETKRMPKDSLLHIVDKFFTVCLMSLYIQIRSLFLSEKEIFVQRDWIIISKDRAIRNTHKRELSIFMHFQCI